MKIKCRVKNSLLEAYLLNRMPAQVAGKIYDRSIQDLEDHLLICQRCLTRAESQEAMVQALKLVQPTYAPTYATATARAK